MLETPQGNVTPLVHVCRALLRSIVPSPLISSLPIPVRLQKYLAYKDLSTKNVDVWSVFYFLYFLLDCKCWDLTFNS